MNTDTVQQATNNNPLLNLEWKEVDSSKAGTNILRIFQLGDEPEIVYIFKSGYTEPQMYHVVFEDAFESPIVHSFLTREQIKQRFNIDL